MGFLRGTALFFIGFILLISLLVGNVLLMLTMSISYDNVESSLVSTFENVIEGGFEVIEGQDINLTEVVEEKLILMQDYCVNNSEFVYIEQDFTFVVPCDVIDEGIEGIVNESIKSVVSEFYYTSYDCDFLDCFGEENIPFFLVSEQSKDYLQGKFYLVLLASTILALLALLLVENKKNFPIVLGALMIISSLPFMKLDIFIFGDVGPLMNFISVFISEASKVFWIFFLSGLVIIGLGITMHSVDLGVFIAEKIKNRKQKVVKIIDKK
jgi:hypothetical protein